MKLQGLVVIFAILGSFSGIWACGSRTGLGVVDEVGNDGEATCSGGSGPGLTNCGASQESCCASLEVAGGTFYRTYANLGSGPAGEADPATVSTFRLDRYLVTVGRFRRFVNAWNGGAGYTPTAGSGKHTYLNGGLGLANSESPGTYEPGWLASDDTYIAPTNARSMATATARSRRVGSATTRAARFARVW